MRPGMLLALAVTFAVQGSPTPMANIPSEAQGRVALHGDWIAFSAMHTGAWHLMIGRRTNDRAETVAMRAPAPWIVLSSGFSPDGQRLW